MIMKVIALCIFLLSNCFLIASKVYAAKTDLVILKNGNHITGEVKSLEFGKLRYSTDDMSTINIQWDKIAGVESKAQFEVELDDTRTFFGSLGISEQEGMLVIVGATWTEEIPMQEVVQITPIEKGFMDRFNGSISFGVNYAKANQLFRLNLAGDSYYRGPKYGGSVQLNAVNTLQQDQETAKKNDLTFNGNRFYAHRWDLAAVLGFEQNSELGLDLRLQLGGGFTRDLILTNANNLRAGAAVMINREWPSGGEPSNNLEGLLGTTYRMFRYDDPERDVTTSLMIYPGLTQWGRIRINFEARARLELFKDFFIDLTFYDNFDNQPATEGAAKNDLGVTFGIGWSY
jgi:hypothetical protein